MPARVPSVKQATFVGGEVSPDLYGREDLQRYGQSAARMSNWFVAPTGAMKNRPGTAFVREVKDSADRCRLIPFVVSKSVSYVLELGDEYMRFHKDGATILDTGVPYELTTPWSAADLLDIRFAQRADVMILVHPLYAPQELRRYADNSWEIVDYSTDKEVDPPTGVALDLAFSWASPTANTHEQIKWSWVVTSVAESGEESVPSGPLTETLAVLYTDRPKPTIMWSAPTTGVTPERYNIYRGRNGIYGYVGSSENLSFIDEAAEPDYTLAPPEDRDPFLNTLPDPTKSTTNGGPAGSGTHTPAGSSSTVLTDANSDFADDELIDDFIKNISDGGSWGIVTDNDGTADTITMSGGLSGGVDNDWDQDDLYELHKMRVIKTESDASVDDNYTWYVIGYLPDPGSSVTIAYESRPSGGGGWTTHDTETFNGPGFAISQRTFSAPGQTANSEFRIRITASTNPIDYITLSQVYWYTMEPPAVTTNYPAAVCFFEQRLVFGGFYQQPQRIAATAVGSLRDWDRRDVPVESDSWDFTLDANTLDDVRCLLSHKALLALTASSEWVGRGVDGGPLTNQSYDLKPRTRTGTSGIQPIAVDSGVLFVGERGRSVHQMIWQEWDTDVGQSAQAPEISLLAEHLFREYGIEEWGWQQKPGRVAWMVREDGVLVGLTLSQQQGILAWHRHTTGPSSADAFESVAVVPEGGEWVPYFIVKRTIDGSTVRYVERMASRLEADTVDSLLFLDSALSYDGRNTTATQLRVTGGTTWEAGESMTMQADAATFAAGDVGDDYELTIGTDTVRFRVTAYTSTTEVTVEPETNVPASMQGSPGAYTSTWGHGFPDFSGLDHLEGATLGLLVDGSYAGVAVVSSGAITLPSSLRGILVQAGLPIPDAVVESLPVSAGQDASLRTAQKIVETIGLELAEWRGMEVGPDLNHLYDVQAAEVELSGSTVQPDHGILVVPSASTWQRNALFAVRQADPLPATLLSVVVGLRAGGNL